MTFAIDFDGTLVASAYPNIGLPKMDVINKAKQLKSDGHILILWTCRQGDRLVEAINFLNNLGLKFDYINNHNENYVKMFGPGGQKVGADYYIDDKNLSIDEFLQQEFVNER